MKRYVPARVAVTSTLGIVSMLSASPAVQAQTQAAAKTRVRVQTHVQAQAAGNWRDVSLPFFRWKATLTDIEAAAPDSVWIVGREGWVSWIDQVVSFGDPIVRRWDGKGWRWYPAIGAPSPLSFVAAVPGEVWIGSDEYSGYLARFDGSVFRRVTPPVPDTRIFGVWAGPAGVWVEQDGLYRRTASGWTRTPMPPGAAGVAEVLSHADNDAWAYDASTGTVLHWDGTSWQTAPRPGSTDPILDLAMGPTGDLWARTGKPPYLGKEEPSRLWHLTGGTWNEVAVPDGELVHNLAVDGSGALWATAQRGAGEPTSVPYYLLLRYDSGTWSKVTVSHSTGLDKIAAVPGTTSLWGTGAGGAVLDSPYVETNS